MPIRIFSNISILGSQRFLELDNTKVGKSIKRVTNGVRVNRDNDNTADFKVSEGLRSDNRILNVTIENLNAADSIIRETGVAKEIAILTRKYILETASVDGKNKPIYDSRYRPEI